MAARLISLMLLALAVCAAGEDVLLERVRAGVRDNLARLPNCICSETIERTERPKRGRSGARFNRLRLEIAFLGGRELVSWPGAGKFDDKDIVDVVGQGGMIGGGNFVLHLRNLFLTAAPKFSNSSKDIRNGRELIRWEFRAPADRSGWWIESAGDSAQVEYHGFVWADARTFDIVRLEMIADDIPGRLAIERDCDAMEYTRVRIGDSEFVMPSATELTMADSAGNEYRNEVHFSDCHQYGAQSEVRFDAPSVPELNTAEPLVVRLDPGTIIEADLRAPINPDRAAAGDAVSAVVLNRESATLSGRLTRVERRWTDVGEFLVIGVRFTSIQDGSHAGEFCAGLEQAGEGSRYAVPFGPANRGPSELRSWVQPPVRGEGVFATRQSRTGVPAGIRMRWRVLDPDRGCAR